MDKETKLSEGKGREKSRGQMVGKTKTDSSFLTENQLEMGRATADPENRGKTGQGKVTEGGSGQDEFMMSAE